jgi:hypothetical protein
MLVPAQATLLDTVSFGSAHHICKMLFVEVYFLNVLPGALSANSLCTLDSGINIQESHMSIFATGSPTKRLQNSQL